LIVCERKLCCNSNNKIVATTFPKGDGLVEWGPRFEIVGTNLDQRNTKETWIFVDMQVLLWQHVYRVFFPSKIFSILILCDHLGFR
jgi:hypothetical protein